MLRLVENEVYHKLVRELRIAGVADRLRATQLPTAHRVVINTEKNG